MTAALAPRPVNYRTGLADSWTGEERVLGGSYPVRDGSTATASDPSLKSCSLDAMPGS